MEESKLRDNKICSVCLEEVQKKEELSDRIFGVLEKCNHVFCLPCIRQWRQLAILGKEPHLIKRCPECRITSDFFIPTRSYHWYENEESKQKLISSYKTKLSKIPCKYFNKSKGSCPRGSSCFYFHPLSGSKKRAGRRPKRRLNTPPRLRTRQEPPSIPPRLSKKRKLEYHDDPSNEWYIHDGNDLLDGLDWQDDVDPLEGLDWEDFDADSDPLAGLDWEDFEDDSDPLDGLDWHEFQDDTGSLDKQDDSDPLEDIDWCDFK